MRILLAEDEHSLGTWLSRALEHAGIQVEWVSDGLMAAQRPTGATAARDVRDFLRSRADAAGTVAQPDLDAAARLFIGMVQSLAMQWLLLGAMGVADRRLTHDRNPRWQSPLSVPLLRLFMGDNHAASQIVAILADMAWRKAR